MHTFRESSWRSLGSLHHSMMERCKMQRASTTCSLLRTPLHSSPFYHSQFMCSWLLGFIATSMRSRITRVQWSTTKLYRTVRSPVQTDPRALCGYLSRTGLWSVDQNILQCSGLEGQSTGVCSDLRSRIFQELNYPGNVTINVAEKMCEASPAALSRCTYCIISTVSWADSSSGMKIEGTPYHNNCKARSWNLNRGGCDETLPTLVQLHYNRIICPVNILCNVLGTIQYSLAPCSLRHSCSPHLLGSKPPILAAPYIPPM